MTIKNSMFGDNTLQEGETLLVFLDGKVMENVDRADAALGYVDILHPTETWICPVTGEECGKREHLLGKVEIVHSGPWGSTKAVAVSS